MNYLDDGSSYDLNLAISYEELLRTRRRALKETNLLPASVHGSNFFFTNLPLFYFRFESNRHSIEGFRC